MAMGSCNQANFSDGKEGMEGSNAVEGGALLPDFSTSDVEGGALLPDFSTSDGKERMEGSNAVEGGALLPDSSTSDGKEAMEGRNAVEGGALLSDSSTGDGNKGLKENSAPAKRPTLKGWSGLPVDVLQLIYKHAADSSRAVVLPCVCTGWQGLNERIVEISFTWCKHGSSLARSVVHRFNQLRSINLSRCRAGDDTISAIAKHCPLLESLNISGSEATDRALKSLTMSQSLRVLSMSGTREISSAGVVHFVSACVQLKCLNLCGSGGLTDDVCIGIGKFCKELEELNLAWCDRVTNEGVIALGGIQSLRLLDISEANITDVGVIALANGCALERLSLFRCTDITDASIDALGRADLAFLNVGGCSLLTASTLQRLCEKCPRLHTCFKKISLHFSGCFRLNKVKCKCVEVGK